MVGLKGLFSLGSDLRLGTFVDTMTVPRDGSGGQPDPHAGVATSDCRNLKHTINQT